MKKISRSKQKNVFQQEIKWQGVKYEVEDLREDLATDKTKLFFGLCLSLGVFIYLFIPLFRMQVLQGEYWSNRSENNYIYREVVDTNRGVIYDSEGNKLVENIVGYKLLMRVYNVGKEEILTEVPVVANVFGLKESDIETLYNQNKDDDTISYLTVKSEISHEVFLRFKSLNINLKYFKLEEVTTRHYLTDPAFTHVLGYTGQASAEEVEAQKYMQGDIIGKDGIEYYYNDILQGTKGSRYLEVDALGNSIVEYRDKKVDPVPGDNLYLSISSDLQRKSYELLENEIEEIGASGGSVVVMDVNSGKIKVMTNYPSFDNNIYIGGITEDEYEAYDLIINDDRHPLPNRAIYVTEAPGSTFKLVVAASILNNKVIDANTIINSPGVIYIGADHLPVQEYGKHAYGDLNIEKALCKSSNIFFCTALMNSYDSPGYEYFVKDATLLGIGQKTGIDLPGESAGILPSPENKASLAAGNPYLDPFWYPEGDTCLTGFGQGIVTVTPIQLTVVSTVIATNGTVYQPTVIDSIEQDGNRIYKKPIIKAENIMDESIFDEIQRGMECGASWEGVISVLADTKVKVAAKTGTAEYGFKNETGEYEHVHVWVTGFFPAENPEYSFTVFIQDGEKSTNAALVIKDLIFYMYENGYLSD